MSDGGREWRERETVEREREWGESVSGERERVERECVYVETG